MPENNKECIYKKYLICYLHEMKNIKGFQKSFLTVGKNLLRSIS